MSYTGYFGSSNPIGGYRSSIRGSGFSLTSLQAYWIMGEASGDRADSTANGNTLVDNNTVGTASALIGTTAASFVAANTEWLSIVDNATISRASGDFEIDGYYYGVGSGVIGSQGNLNNYNTTAWSFETTGSAQPKLFIGNGSANVNVACTNAATAGAWHYFSISFDSTTNKGTILFDAGGVGNTATTGVLAGGWYDTTNPLVWARWSVFNGGYTTTRLQHIGVWKRLLTASEHTQRWNGGAGLALFP